MEYKLEASEISCLTSVVSQQKQQEQTQEVKLTEGMPDVGRILGCWGQPLIRGKDWRSDSIGLNGGVMAWVLYAAEDGTGARTLTCWIPFQTRYDIPNTQADGSITATVQISSMDARISSARRIMVRCCLQLGVNGAVRSRQTVYSADNIPREIQLRQEIYPLQLTMEAGEREIAIDEQIQLPGNYPSPETIVRFSLQPKVSETKLMGSRLILRGLCSLRMVYMSEDGEVCSWDAELPVAQYSDLSGEYGSSAQCRCVPTVTGAELDRGEDGRYRLKASLAMQYEIIDRVMVSVTEDAYCPGSNVEVHTEPLCLPALLDMRTDAVELEQVIHADARQVVDCCVYTTAQAIHATEDGLSTQLRSDTQVLYLDEHGQLQGGSVRTETEWALPSEPENKAEMLLIPGIPNVVVGEDIRVHCDLSVQSAVYANACPEMVRSLTVTEKPSPQQPQPALILKRSAGRRLWDIAKETGSTVEAICKANKLEQEPLDDRMLLIPVL